jgi:hypothetical protein
MKGGRRIRHNVNDGDAQGLSIVVQTILLTFSAHGSLRFCQNSARRKPVALFAQENPVYFSPPIFDSALQYIFIN